MKSRFGIGLFLSLWLALPASAATLVQGECWLDDDPQFDAGQVNGGPVIGRSSFELRQECGFVAQMRYGTTGSSDVTNIHPVQGDGLIQAECWIDDDKDFDMGQVSAGKLFGESTWNIRQECQLIAKKRYGEVGSSGIANAVITSTQPGGMLQGHCWIDDDPQFDAGQIDAGLVFGKSSLALRQECALVASERYGSNGSSDVADIQAASGGNQVQAECWIDDDKDFDFGQTSGGTLIGDSTYEIRQECQLIAKQRFGEVSSSGLANAKLINGGPTGLLQGHCWIDDDPQFDAGQIDAGLVIGWGSRSLREECDSVAKERYGAQGSSSVIDIQPVTGGGSQIQADCWIDDDKDFDMGQTFGGKLFGTSTSDLRQECRLIATNRYGANSSSGLANVQVLP